MKIISIDPGYERLGVAIIEKGVGAKKETLVFSECFKTSAKLPFYDRLRTIGLRIEELIELYKPEALAIEKLFFSGNQKTAMLVSEARGVIIYEGVRKHLPVFEYNPVEIKVAITSYGKSDKKAIIGMIPKLISLNKVIKHDDEYDAIATGLTFFAVDYRTWAQK